MEISLNIPDELSSRIHLHKNQLKQILFFGLRELNAKPSGTFAGLSDVLEFLASLPTTEEILRLRPSPQLLIDIEGIVEKQKTTGLTIEEEMDWQQYQYVEHLVRLAKLNAMKKQHRE
ncbi:hypothetical protein TI05_14520 [Achromatium sp. WMS3]|nr:hypothetical protein TI05_14520 [Achromatium sp. WMS3]